ncbi:MAG: ribosome maturation factor RimM [Acidimicrobiia bacterium]|nr:ribosome maturation factor RimM [Acidimicrobiia bacterium]
MADTPGRIPVGYIRRAHGLHGDVILRPLTDDPDRFVVGAAFESDEVPPRRLTIADIREHKDGLLLRFEEVRNRNPADAMRGVTLTIDPHERRDLAQDEYWPEDLEGLSVELVDGTTLGTVESVITGGAQDRLVVATDAGAAVEVPFVAAIATEVDLAAGRIVIDPPPGLFE